MKKRITVFVLTLIIFQYAQAFTNDSLLHLEYSMLSKKLKSTAASSGNWKPYGETWKKKAQSEQNWKELSAAYRAIMFLSEKSTMRAYADTLVNVSIKSREDGTIGAAYLTRGIVLYDLKQHEKALDNYIIAIKYLVKTQDKYTTYKARYALGHSKYFLGYYHEAIGLFKDCMEYFKHENDRAYLNSLHSLGLCYTMLGEYNLSSHYNTIGLAAAAELEEHTIDSYFIHSEGVNRFLLNDYDKAIKYLEKAIPVIIEKKDMANASVGWFYIGKSLLALNRSQQALPYFVKVDSVFTLEAYIRPDLREAYDILLKFYTKESHPAKHAYYMENSLKAEKTLAQEYKHLAGKMQREWIAPIQLETARRNQNLKLGIILTTTVGAAIIGTLCYRQRRLRKQYSRKFRELMDGVHTVSKPKVKRVRQLDINEETVQMVLKRLERFEAEKKYLSKDMELQRLASYLNTNTKYASRIIYVYRGKGVVEYIRDLKLDHLIELLKTQRKFRHYTYDALAQEVGFGSAQNFTRAFKSRFDFAPSYFISQLEKELS